MKEEVHLFFDNRIPDRARGVRRPARYRLGGRTGREAELVGAPVLFAEDAASALRRAEYSLDADAWLPLEAVDGVIDSKAEKFYVGLENLSPANTWL